MPRSTITLVQQRTQLSTNYSEFELPDELRSAVQRHQKNIANLVVRLRSVGMTEALIKRSTDQLLESYRPELVRAIGTLGNSHNA